jgi:long-chain fatty acid transport protein
LSLDAQGITAWGYNVGYMFKPSKSVTLGFNYRSEIIMKARGGSASFKDVPAFATTLTDTQFDADLPLPAEITAGISYKPSDKWLFAFDWNHTKWSAYKSLDVTFANGLTPSINPRNYADVNSYRFGAQYKATEKIVVRGGYYIDNSPVQKGYFAPETPRNDSKGYTAGFTYQVTKKLGIDASFLYLHFDQIDASYDYNANGNFGGTYKSVAFSPGLGITYSL